jgi:hypothetical protein
MTQGEITSSLRWKMKNDFVLKVLKVKVFGGRKWKAL